MDLQLTDKIVLITGGAKGIGAAIARACVREGAMPVVVDRDAEAGKKLEEELRGHGLKIKCIAVELSDVEACRQTVEEVLKSFGRVDVLINNAGVNDRVGLEDGSPEKYRESLKRNLLHYYDIAHFCLKSLKDSGGNILNIASKTALTGQGGTSGYASSKGAILALTREWAAELSPYGIRVNAIVPAEVMTPLYRQWVDSFPNPEEKLNAIISKIPLGKRMTHVDEIAAVAVFLISGKAGHITGQHLFVDGGYVHLDRALT